MSPSKFHKFFKTNLENNHSKIEQDDFIICSIIGVPQGSFISISHLSDIPILITTTIATFGPNSDSKMNRSIENQNQLLRVAAYNIHPERIILPNYHS